MGNQLFAPTAPGNCHFGGVTEGIVAEPVGKTIVLDICKPVLVVLIARPHCTVIGHFCHFCEVQHGIVPVTCPPEAKTRSPICMRLCSGGHLHAVVPHGSRFPVQEQSKLHRLFCGIRRQGKGHSQPLPVVGPPNPGGGHILTVPAAVLKANLQHRTFGVLVRHILRLHIRRKGVLLALGQINVLGNPVIVGPRTRSCDLVRPPAGMPCPVYVIACAGVAAGQVPVVPVFQIMVVQQVRRHALPQLQPVKPGGAAGVSQLNGHRGSRPQGIGRYRKARLHPGPVLGTGDMIRISIQIAAAAAHIADPDPGAQIRPGAHTIRLDVAAQCIGLPPFQIGDVVAAVLPAAAGFGDLVRAAAVVGLGRIIASRPRG